MYSRIHPVLLTVCLAFAFLSLAAMDPVYSSEEKANEKAKADGAVSFYRDIQPILRRKCQGCHQPSKKGGKLIVTSYDELAKGGRRGKSWVEGKPDDSLLVKYLTGEKKPRMPKGEDPLPEEEIELFRRWIREGARDDTPASARQAADLSQPPVYHVPPVVSALAFSPDGSLLAVAGYREIFLMRGDGSELLDRLVGLSQRIETLIFTPDGSQLVAVGGSPGRYGEVQIWDVGERELRFSTTVGYDTLYGADLSDDGKLLAFGAPDKAIRIFSIEEGKVVRRIDQHEDWCFGASFSHDGSKVVSVSRDRTMKLCETATGSFIDNVTSITPGVLGGPLYALARHPKEDKFLTGGEDGIPKLYKIVRTKARRIGDDDNLLRRYETMPGPISAVAFDATGSRIAVGSLNGWTRVYETESGKKLSEFREDRAVYTVKFHPREPVMAVGGFDGYVRFFHPESGKRIKEFLPAPITPVEAASAD